MSILSPPPALQGEVGRGLSKLAGKIKSDPSLALPCKQGREYLPDPPCDRRKSLWDKQGRGI
jgi:hypothetical protein